MIVNPQVLASVFCNLGACSFGILVGWLSPALPQIVPHSEQFGDFSVEESAWLASIFTITGLLAPITTILSDIVGRKKCVILSAIPFAVNGIIILTARSKYLLLVGRFIGGLGGIGILCTGPIYIAEIADPKIRGKLGSTYNLLYTIGILMVYSFGGFISYRAGAVLMIAIASLNIILFSFMPETPLFLIKNGRTDEAIKSIAWLNNKDPNSLFIKAEIERLKSSFEENKTSMFQAAKLLFTSRPLFQGFALCLLTFFGQGYTGMYVVHGYSVTIFSESGAMKLSPEAAAVLYSCIQVSAALSTTWFIEKLGRKILLLVSFIGVSGSMMTMGTYFYSLSIQTNLKGLEWIPVVALCICVYAYTIGAGGIPYILVADLISSEVRPFATMLVFQIMSTNSFLMLKFFEPLSEIYGRHVLFYFFGTCSIISIFFVIFCIPETKGKSNEEILDMNYGFKGKIEIGQKSKKTDISYSY